MESASSEVWTQSLLTELGAEKCVSAHPQHHSLNGSNMKRTHSKSKSAGAMTVKKQNNKKKMSI